MLYKVASILNNRQNIMVFRLDKTSQRNNIIPKKIAVFLIISFIFKQRLPIHREVLVYDKFFLKTVGFSTKPTYLLHHVTVVFLVRVSPTGVRDFESSCTTIL